MQIDQFLRAWIRQRLQKNAISYAENRAVGADANRQRNGRDRGKHRRSSEPPQNVPKSHREYPNLELPRSLLAFLESD